MPPKNLRFLLTLLVVTLCGFNGDVRADECNDFANRSVRQQDNNLFNLCGYRGSQWTSSKKQLLRECRVMSRRDRKQRLMMRDKLLASCPEYEGF